MAQITFNPNQPIQALSGTVGGVTFRTMYGRTYVHSRTEPVLPENPTRQQRERFKQRTIIDQCVDILQSQYEDMQIAIAMRPKIRDRIVRLYKKYAPTIKARTKLQRKIMTEYYQKFAKTSSNHSRGFVDPFSNHSRMNPKKEQTYDHAGNS